MCVNNLPKVITWKRKAGSRTRDLFSRKSKTLPITPPGHTVEYMPVENSYDVFMVVCITLIHDLLFLPISTMESGVS